MPIDVGETQAHLQRRFPEGEAADHLAAELRTDGAVFVAADGAAAAEEEAPRRPGCPRGRRRGSSRRRDAPAMMNLLSRVERVSSRRPSPRVTSASVPPKLGEAARIERAAQALGRVELVVAAVVVQLGRQADDQVLVLAERVLDVGALDVERACFSVSFSLKRCSSPAAALTDACSHRCRRISRLARELQRQVGVRREDAGLPEGGGEPRSCSSVIGLARRCG